MRRLLRAIAAASLYVLAVAGAAAAGNGGLAPVAPESPNAEGIRRTYWLILGLTGAVFLIVEVTLILFIVRFRGRGRARSAEGPQIHGATRLELLWTGVPVLVLAAIAAFVFVKLPAIEDAPAAGTAGEVRVRVEGHQYYWQFRYPGGQLSVDRLVVPVRRVVRLEVVSPDVVHSWWVPALGGKIDAIPGRTNQTWFRVRRTGVWKARCAEFCGLEHARMTATVEAVPQAEYERFLAAHAPGSAAVGKEVFAGACAKCHGLAGEGDYGPPIAGSALLGDPKALESLLRQGKNKMPAVGRDWSDQQVKATSDYLKERFGGSQG